MRIGGEDNSIRILPALAVVLVCTASAYANPCGPHPTEMAAWIIVVLAAMALEVLITTGFLLFSGLAVVPTALVLFLVNAVSYVGIVLPLYEVARSIWLVEVVVLVAETGLIKLLSLFGPFQQDAFGGLKWRHALLAALAGNACSYYVGTLLATQ
ncbi:MAG TPA: hypothetical protein VLI39_02680 [Sedimentisphaerales bacterium]|nr:hypothetical protein [Sedimentisphaerales bacterium]